MRFRSSVCFVLISAALLSLAVTVQAQSKSRPVHKNADLATRIERVENGIPPIPISGSESPMQLNLEKLMQLYKCPGLSVVVVDNFKII